MLSGDTFVAGMIGWLVTGKELVELFGMGSELESITIGVDSCGLKLVNLATFEISCFRLAGAAKVAGCNLRRVGMSPPA